MSLNLNLRLSIFIIGLLLVLALLGTTDVPSLVRIYKQIEIEDLFIVFTVYAVIFVCDTLSWQALISSVSHRPETTIALLRIRIMGEAYNASTPLGSLGGEPLKAWLLTKTLGTSYYLSARSIVECKVAALISLAIFSGIALYISNVTKALSQTHERQAVFLFTLLLMMTLALVIATKSAGAVTRFAKSLNLDSKMGRSLASTFRFIGKDPQLHGNTACANICLSIAMALFAWFIGAAECYAIFFAIGSPISWSHAVVIEASLQLTRTLAFFVPAGLGVQELVMWSVAAPLTSSSASVAAALMRRGREICWIVAGLALSASIPKKGH